MRKEVADKILAETEAGYDRIADKFSGTRKFFWRDLESIRDYVRDGDKVLDFGCGNGRLLEILGNTKIEYVGADVSADLLDIARAKYPDADRQFLKITGSDKLPFPEGYFNIVFSIAVFHHLPGRELRLEIVKELVRVLKPGSCMVVTVWNLWQKKYLKNILSNWWAKLSGRSRLDWNDCYIDFDNNETESFRRYHHAYRLGELAGIFYRAGLVVEKTESVAGRNLLIVARKA